MTWTYDDTLASTRDKVRFELGDTDSTDPLVTDEEIAAKLTANGDNVYSTAADIANYLSAKYARKVDTRIGDLSKSYSQLSKHYSDLATRLEQKATALGVEIFAGGVFQADRDARDEDTSTSKPSFTRDQFANNG